MFRLLLQLVPLWIYTLSLHDALPICKPSTIDLDKGLDLVVRRERRVASGEPIEPMTIRARHRGDVFWSLLSSFDLERSEEHTSELQSQFHFVCRLLLYNTNCL